MLNKIKAYVALSKPGIVYSNLFVAVSGFYLASSAVFNYLNLFWFIIGFALVLISSTSFNNYIDQDIDSNLTPRTKARALKISVLSNTSILVYATTTGAVGFALMWYKTTMLAFWLSVFAFFVYVVVYSVWAKRKTVYSTFIGSFSGAAPPLIGFTAFSNAIDAQGVLFFLILFTWQMYHFFAIAIFRIQDYKGVGIPLLPIVKDVKTAKMHIFYWMLLSIACSVALVYFSYLSLLFTIFIIAVTVLKIYVLKGFKVLQTVSAEIKWAKRVFFVSIIEIVFLGVFIIIDTIFMV